MKRHRILVRPLRQRTDQAAIGLGDDTTLPQFLAGLVAQRAAVGTAWTLADPRAPAGTNNITGEEP